MKFLTFSNFKEPKYAKIFYLIAFVQEIYFIAPIWLFFFLRIFDYKQIALLIALRAISAVVFEIPTGAFADIFGRRISVVLAYLLFTIVNIFFLITTSFNVFIFLVFIGGLGRALFSGSYESLVYDTLKQNKDENKYDTVIANITTLEWLGLFISAFGGGILYNIDYRIPYIITAFINLSLAITIYLFIKEPKIDSVKYDLSFKHYLKQNIKGVSEIFRDKKMTILTLFIITVSFGYNMASEFLGISQAKDYGLDPAKVGFLFAAGYILSAIFSQFYPKIKEFLGKEKLILMVTAILVSSFLFAKFVGIVVGCILIFSRIASSTLFSNLKSSVLNKEFTSKNRATALSTLNLFVVLPYAISVTFVGDYIDKTSPNDFAFILGLILLTVVLVVIGYKGLVYKKLQLID